MGFSSFLRIGNREKVKVSNVLSDVFESTLGAVYLENGLVGARAHLTKHLYPWISHAISTQAWMGTKGRVQKYLNNGNNFRRSNGSSSLNAVHLDSQDASHPVSLYWKDRLMSRATTTTKVASVDVACQKIALQLGLLGLTENAEESRQ